MAAFCNNLKGRVAQTKKVTAQRASRGKNSRPAFREKSKGFAQTGCERNETTVMLDLLPERLKEWHGHNDMGKLARMNREGQDAGLGHTKAGNNP